MLYIVVLLHMRKYSIYKYNHLVYLEAAVARDIEFYLNYGLGMHVCCYMGVSHHISHNMVYHRPEGQRDKLLYIGGYFYISDNTSAKASISDNRTWTN